MGASKKKASHVSVGRSPEVPAAAKPGDQGQLESRHGRQSFDSLFRVRLVQKQD